MSETERSGERYSRRRALLAVGAGLAAGLAGCSDLTDDPSGTEIESDAPATPTSTRTNHTETRSTEPQLSEATNELRQQVQNVRDSTAEYQDMELARSDGYTVLGPYQEGMGWHLINEGQVAEAANSGFTLEKPPLLTYVRTGDGLRLASVEYAAPVAEVESNPDLFADDGTPVTETWNTHHEATHVFATPDNMQADVKSFALETLLTNEHWSEYTPADDSLKPGETATLNWGSTEGKSGERTMRTVDFVITHPELRTLHVWLHEDNPRGVFAETNPRFAPGEGGHDHDGGHSGESTQNSTAGGN